MLMVCGLILRVIFIPNFKMKTALDIFLDEAIEHLFDCSRTLLIPTPGVGFITANRPS